MRNALVRSPADTDVLAAPVAYRRAEEHLADLLRRLDLQLRRLLIGRESRNTTDFLGFAAISDQEVLRLLAAPAPVPEDEPEARESELLADELAELEAVIGQRLASARDSGYQPPLVELGARLGLSSLEQDLLILAAAPEFDRRYERVFGYLQDDMGRKLPSLGLGLTVCASGTSGSPSGPAVRRVISAAAPLRRWRLLELLDDGLPTPWLAKPMRLDERLVGHLLGDTAADARIADLLLPDASRPQRWPLTARAASARDTLAQLLDDWAAPAADRARPLLYLHGAPGSGAVALFEQAVRGLGFPVLKADLEAGGLEPEERAALLCREAVLRGAALCLRGIESLFDADRGGAFRRALERGAATGPGPVALVGRGPWRWSLPAPPLVLRTLGLAPATLSEQLDIWRGLLAGTDTPVDIDATGLERLVSRRPLPVARILDAWRLAVDRAGLRGDAIGLQDLEHACHTGAHVPQSGLTRRIEPRHGWSDLVLPPAQLSQLRALCSQATHRATVYGVWGFERRLSLGKGISALFSGPPGTGKTMAAEVIAADLDLPLLAIDLSQVVSKYIGETEKNLRVLFDQAAEAHAILFFDEADALLGKRSAIGDAHDRYANTEVAYLLQKMEEFEGITILATNLRQNMDEAFTRRMRFVVDFPFPEEDDRLRIWEGVWPAQVPRGPDIDLARMARQFRFAGGNIRNIAVASAFLAAAEGRPVAMGHLLHSARGELQKMGRLVADGEERFRV